MPRRTTPELIHCGHPTCPAEFFHSPGRQYPGLCLDHADEAIHVARCATIAPTAPNRAQVYVHGILRGELEGSDVYLVAPVDGHRFALIGQVEIGDQPTPASIGRQIAELFVTKTVIR